MAQWIRSQSLNCEVAGSNLVAVVPLGNALYPHQAFSQKVSGCLLDTLNC